MTAKDRKHREFIMRWVPARQMYMMGKSSRQIAEAMNLNSVQAVERRITRFRKQFGWFMFRLQEPAVTSSLGLGVGLDS